MDYMLFTYREMKFNYAYNLAGFLKSKVQINAPEDHLTEIIEVERHKIIKPNKNTVLHDYISYELINEFEYIGRKAAPNELYVEWEELLNEYKIDISDNTLDKNDDEEIDEYIDFLEGKIKDHVVEKICVETFQLLFSDRYFCLKFNSIISEEIHKLKFANNDDILESDGKPIRCTYFPEWVQKAVFLRDRGCCAVCLIDLSGLLKTDFNDAIDHIVPLNLGGINDITNFQLICKKCNLKKLGHTITTSEFYPLYF